MTVLAADRQTQSRHAGLQKYPVVATDIIYKGAIVAVNDAGFAKPAADAANERVVGIADETVDNSAGAAGDLDIRVASGRAYRLVATAITQAMVGDPMYVVDDGEVDDGGGTNSVVVGRLKEFISATEGWVLIPDGGPRKAGAAGGTYTAAEQAILNDLV